MVCSKRAMCLSLWYSVLLLLLVTEFKVIATLVKIALAAVTVWSCSFTSQQPEELYHLQEVGENKLCNP